MNKTWFTTGASRGFGRIWTEAALRRGDNVAATARKLADVADLTERFGNADLTLALDVTDGEHTNYFGMLRVIQAALPLLRKQGSGHILGVSSALGIVTMPLIGFYCTSKWAVEALHESLAQEVKPFGIKVTLIEPGAYATDFGKSAKSADVLEPYADFRKQIMANLVNAEFGDPQATSEAILKLVDAEQPPLRLILGDKNLPMARAVYADRLATWEAWEDVSNAAQGEPRKSAIAAI